MLQRKQPWRHSSPSHDRRTVQNDTASTAAQVPRRQTHPVRVRFRLLYWLCRTLCDRISCSYKAGLRPSWRILRIAPELHSHRNCVSPQIQSVATVLVSLAVLQATRLPPGPFVMFQEFSVMGCVKPIPSGFVTRSCDEQH